MKKILLILSAAATLVLAGCNDDNKAPVQTAPVNESQQTTINEQAAAINDASHNDMNHTSTGELPSNLKQADNPKYPVGSTATIITDHMGGMKDAKATIVGAFDTMVYSISYTPTTGGDKVTDHKWIVHEEIMDAQDSPYKVGDKVRTSGNHMPGMNDAEATIDSVNKTIVYVVDYTDTQNGEQVKNHQWVTEDELKK
ncbi:MAG: DUF1541 domain-containing protein [Candidatus Oceanisphaera merdipullorum]|nr:DUF1541 domain-containing protein [Candidatus Oceanisphaera merdipullorum]